MWSIAQLLYPVVEVYVFDIFSGFESEVVEWNYVGFEGHR